MWTHQTLGPVVGRVLQILTCDNQHYLVVNVYCRFAGKQPTQRTMDGVQYVLGSMLLQDLHLVPLINVGNLLPCALISDGPKVLIAPYV